MTDWSSYLDGTEKCPTCGEFCKGKTGLKQHHSRAHGEKLKDTQNCAYCGDEYVSSRYKQIYCSQECFGKSQTAAAKVERTIVECANCGNTFRVKQSEAKERRFCSKNCVGEYYSDPDVWKEPKEKRASLSGYWHQQREKRLEKDDYTCQDCGATGAGLHVHHIIPRRKFDDLERAHALDNLVTLCPKCHNRWEGIPLRPELYQDD